MSRKIGSESLVRSGSQNPFSPVIPVPDDWRVHDMSLGGSPNFDLQLRLKDKNGVIDPTPITLPLSSLVSYVENSTAEAAASAVLLTYASNAEALSGTSNSRIMSPLRVREKMLEQGRLGRGYTLFNATNYSFIWATGDPEVTQQLMAAPLVVTPSETSGVELIVSAKVHIRVEQTGTDDDATTKALLQYKDAAGVWQDARFEAATGQAGLVNGIMPGDYFEATIPLLTRLTSAHQNAAGNWELRVAARNANDATPGYESTASSFHSAIYAQEIFGGPL